MSDGGFLSNLIADLRDRHLLPVIGVLALAIVAVPFVLHKSAEPAPPAAEPVTSADDGSAVPAVFTGTEGVRAYQRRLTALAQKNPFQDHFTTPTTPKPSGTAGTDPGTVSEPVPTIPDTSASSAGSTDTTSSSSGDSASTSFSVSPSEPSVSTDYTPADTGGTDGSSSSNTTEVKVKHTDYELSYEVDLNSGPAGGGGPHDGVPEMTFLPSEERPIAIFVGVTQDAEKALFMLSTDVTDTAGDGSCMPSAADCQFLALREGERRTITYQPEGSNVHKYYLEVTAINPVVVEKGKHVSEDVQHAGTPSGITAWLGG